MKRNEKESNLDSLRIVLRFRPTGQFVDPILVVVMEVVLHNANRSIRATSLISPGLGVVVDPMRQSGCNEATEGLVMRLVFGIDSVVGVSNRTIQKQDLIVPTMFHQVTRERKVDDILVFAVVVPDEHQLPGLRRRSPTRFDATDGLHKDSQQVKHTMTET